MKKSSAFLLLFLSVTCTSFSRTVMSWIPVYGINTAKAYMNDATQSQWLKEGVTHIGLQFWVPGDAGAVDFVTDYQYTWYASTISQSVQDFVTWGNANNVKILLCLHNVRESDFDWSITQEVINNYPDETVASLLDIIELYGLDGVDIDFEGTGDYNSDKPAFVSFLDVLGTALHADGKELSVDMFSTPCYNSPNPSWESAMAPHVDFMNIMGYNDTYENNNTLFAYCPMTPSESNSYAFRYSYIEDYLTETQGVPSSQLNYGLPAWEESWGGQCVQANILDILDVSTAGGIAIWDLRLSGSGFWLDPDTWQLIKLFREDYSAAQIRSQLASICGTPTPIAHADGSKAEMYFDAVNHQLHLPANTGEISLYRATGTLENNWRIEGRDQLTLAGLRDGFYVVKFDTASGTYLTKIVVVH